ncbi:MAG: hypothetical protein ACREYE_04860 [Gammaproteobacteria bacterium]
MPSIISYIALLLGSLLFTGNAGMAQVATEQNPPTASSLFVRYNKGVIDAHINNTALGDVLRELETLTGARFILNDPARASQRISVVIETMPFDQAVKRILKGFSYAIYPVADVTLLGVVVLSTPIARTRTGHSGVKPGISSLPTPTDGARVPQSLDDFQPVALEEEGSEPSSDNQDGDEAIRFAKEQERREISLHRALDALKSDYTHLHGEAINVLVGLDDPRAMEALVKAASRSGTISSAFQVRIAEALWRRAADQVFANEAVVNALEQLAQDGEGHVSSIAHQALRDMQQYQKANATQ